MRGMSGIRKQGQKRETKKENWEVNEGLEKEATKIRIRIKVEVVGTECLQAWKEIE